MDKPIDTATHDTKTRNQRHEREDQVAKKIVWLIVTVVMCIVFVVGLIVYNNMSYNFQPYNTKDTALVEVEIEQGYTLRDLAQTLEEKKLIRSASTFNFYVKTKDIGGLQAGYYAISPSMTFDDIIQVIKTGRVDKSQVLAKVLIKEGDTINDIVKTLANVLKVEEQTVMNAVNDEAFISEMVQKYPELLTSMTTATNLKYKLEGYLFPATYDVVNGDTVKTLLTKMITKTDDVMSNFYEAIKSQNKTVHQVLTIASLAEKEGVTTEDRQKIVSVFNNRLAQNMPLQSDITVLYALGVHKEIVTFSDLEVDSAYNLYKHTGYGPGPFNSPSEEAIHAALNPQQTDFLYFVADLKTGNVYYSKTLEEHNALVEKYVNNN